jgi:hypothetical protein
MFSFPTYGIKEKVKENILKPTVIIGNHDVWVTYRLIPGIESEISYVIFTPLQEETVLKDYTHFS